MARLRLRCARCGWEGRRAARPTRCPDCASAGSWDEPPADLSPLRPRFIGPMKMPGENADVSAAKDAYLAAGQLLMDAADGAALEAALTVMKDAERRVGLALLVQDRQRRPEVYC